MPQHDSSVFMLVNVVRDIINLLLISFSDLPSSAIKLLRYIYDVTCSIRCPSMAIFILGEFGFFADNHCLGLLDINFHSNLFSDFVYALSSAYLRLTPFILIIKLCLKIFSVYKLKRVGDAAHPCLSRRCIRISSDNSFMILTDAVCPQYKFLMIFMSFPSTPISLRHCTKSGLGLTRSNAFS